MKEKEEEVKLIFSPGFFISDKGLVFEEVKNGTFASSELMPELKTEYEGYTPLTRVAWALVEKPIEYETDSKLWHEIRQFIYEHLFLPDENLYDILTAWVISTWIHEVWSVVPYIFFYGPVASGKTRGLEILNILSYRGIISSNISTSALFRVCEKWHPTLVLDETEIYNKAERNEIIGLLNSGYRRGQYAIRVKITPEDELLEIFDVFGFKALAGTEGLARTLESRSIVVRMIKNRRSVRLHVDQKKAEELRSKLLKWRFDKLHGAELSEVSEGFADATKGMNLESGRLEELFQCLVAISNDGRENILKYAKKMTETRQFEERSSYEAEIIETLLKCASDVENGVILTKIVAEKFNSTRLEKERWKTTSVSKKIHGLGFEPRHTEKGNGFFYDRERLLYYKQIYIADTIPTIKASEPSEPSAVSQERLYEVCKFCGKPITDSTHDWIIESENGDKKDHPAHNECADKWRELKGYTDKVE